ncbi:hypothetical protein MNV49_002839 [Pseudohyphozyma bogoriensis]|nr:hypothetical protein MNV49_002839 [Pseudohyphozyma bogoriensis]
MEYSRPDSETQSLSPPSGDGDGEADQPVQADGGAAPKTTAKTACMACRGLKMRCLRTSGGDDAPCDRKYKGVDRALRQIQTELKRVKNGTGAPADVLNLLASTELGADDSTLLTSLLAAQQAQGRDATAGNAVASTSGTSNSSQQLSFQLPPPPVPHSQPPPPPHPRADFQIPEPLPDPHMDNIFLLNTLKRPHDGTGQSQRAPFSLSHILSPTPPPTHSPSPHSSSADGPRPGPSAAISNPLGLLAEASEAVRPSPLFKSGFLSADSPYGSPEHHQKKTKVTDMLNTGPLDSRVANLGLSWDSVNKGLKAITADPSSKLAETEMDFFRPKTNPAVRGDVGPEYDPIDLALITPEEVQTFFRVFYAHLHPLISALDQTLHTPEFIRSRSAFLFSAILFNGAQFTPEAGPVTRRLQLHTERLARLVVERRWKSLEIGQGFLVWMPWIPPGNKVTDDTSWFYTSYNFTMATELGLDKPISAQWPLERQVAALGQDLDNMDATSQIVVDQMIRNRERFWLSFSPLPHDKETSAIVRLRRYIISLSTEIRTRLATNPAEGTSWIREYIDASLDPWHRQWLLYDTVEAGSTLPSVYVELLYRVGRLWCLSQGLHHRAHHDEEGPIETPAIVNDCVVSALEAVHAAVKGLESSRFYWKMPNTVFPMISWAACLSMRLFDCDVGIEGFFSSQATLLGFLGNLAVLLEQVGTTPSHRLGTAAIYGRHLQAIVRSRLNAVWKLHAETVESASTGVPLPPLTILPGTVTPVVAENGSSIPLASWGTEWWNNEDGVPWGETDMLSGLLQDPFAQPS